MKILSKYSLFLFISLLIVPAVYADSLGRLYTSPSERVKLEKARNAKPKPEEVQMVDIPTIEELTKPETEEEEVTIGAAITVKGIVQRSDGKNAAWLNESNTFEGDLESQYITVDNNEITQDYVKITMPDNETKIKLKVGDKYDPQNNEDL